MKLSSPSFQNQLIDLNFGKFASEAYLVNGLPQTSFQLDWEVENVNSHFVHLIFIDYDAISAGAKPFVHWSVANIPVTDFPHGLKENASLELKTVLNQGVNSLIGAEIQNPNKWAEYSQFLGSMPPNSDHFYTMMAFTTSEAIAISNPFTPDKLFRVLLTGQNVVEHTYIEGMYPYKI